MKSVNLNWYLRRLRPMSPAEVALRARDEARHRLWQGRQVRPGAGAANAAAGRSGAGDGAPGAAATAVGGTGARPASVVAPAVPGPARQALLDAADGLRKGRWEILGVDRDDLDGPDWFFDPVTGRRAPDARYCFAINTRSAQQTGNIKQIWEVSRHHHLTVLAAAFYVSGDERYALMVDRQLTDWWDRNPFLSGVHWTSGIEVGLRLIAWAWIRRLLDGWEGAAALFEGNSLARQHVRWHQEYLAAFRSSGSSANNHVIAEAAGQLVASCAFPWFDESARWRCRATALLTRELERNTFPSGLNRELASAYHGFVAELGLVAAVEADAAGHPLGDQAWTRLCRIFDVAAAVVDETLRPPRQGDDDEGRVLLLDAPTDHSWNSLLAGGAAVFGPLDWWPATTPDVRSALLGSFASRRPFKGVRPSLRPSHFADAGLTILRTSRVGSEIWCRGDAGPHGYLGIAAHAHADALSVEVRAGGVDVLADPGTFCYHGDPEWRNYFRSTAGHNTLELAGRNQSESGGPFLWIRHATSRSVEVVVGTEDLHWVAEHDGYASLAPPAIHRRAVHLDPVTGRLEIVDSVEGGPHPCRLMFHLGPAVDATFEPAATVVSLAWPRRDGPARATMSLPQQLQWRAHRGEHSPILGWYSPGFGRTQPATTLVGTGFSPAGGAPLVTILEFEL